MFAKLLKTTKMLKKCLTKLYVMQFFLIQSSTSSHLVLSLMEIAHSAISKTRPKPRLDLRKASNSKNQCPNSFSVPTFPKETQKTDRIYENPQVLDLGIAQTPGKRPTVRTNVPILSSYLSS